LIKFGVSRRDFDYHMIRASMVIIFLFFGCEWLFGALLFARSSDKKLGILGPLGGIATFVSTFTIIPFMPNGWAAPAGGFDAMT
jgi:hypothetical protein